MPAIFIPDFDFEHQLASGLNYQPNAQLKRINSELLWVWLCLIKKGDFLLTDAVPEKSFMDRLVQQGLPVPRLIHDPRMITELKQDEFDFSPWGWSELIESVVPKGTSHPSINVVRKINSRTFSFELETEWNIGLEGAISFINLDKIEQHLKGQKEKSGKWIIKAEFSMSGRERIVGEGDELSEAQVNWINKRIGAGHQLFYEPLVHIVEEAGIQLTIPKTGQPVVEGIVPLVSTPNGGYQGSFITPSDTDIANWQESVERGIQVAQRIQAEGYWGPFGIDAVVYEESNGKRSTRPLQDINGRWTMGRSALEFQRYLKQNEEGFFFHLSRKNLEAEKFRDQLKTYSDELSNSERIIELSPWMTDGLPNRLLMFLITAKDRNRCLTIAEELKQLEQSV